MFPNRKHNLPKMQSVFIEADNNGRIEKICLDGKELSQSELFEHLSELVQRRYVEAMRKVGVKC